MKAKSTQPKTWTVKIEMLVQHVTFVEVEASSAEEAACLALNAEDEHDFYEEVEASGKYVYSVRDDDQNAVTFYEARKAGHEVFQKVDVSGLESLPNGALNDVYAGLVEKEVA